MWAWLISFFSSKAVPAIQHALWRTVSVVCVVLVIGGLFWTVYVTVVKPHIRPTPTTTVESGGVSNTYNYEIKLGLGSCARISPEVKR